MRHVSSLLILALLPALLSLGCSKTPEEAGDSFLKMSEKAQNPKIKEEREKKAYLKYLEGLNIFIAQGKPVPATLQEKVLKITLSRLNRELFRMEENAEEANLEQIELWRDDFKRYLPNVKNEDLTKGYSEFLLSLADTVPDLEAKLKVLNEVTELGALASRAKDKIAALTTGEADALTDEVAEMMEKAAPEIKKNKEAKEQLVFAEYKALLALKRDPKNEKAKAQLKALRPMLLDIYSGYERFEENLDPDIDKYDIYLSVPKQRTAKNALTMEVAVWNLTASPITVKKENFFLVTDEGDTLPADAATRFDKIQLDIKTDSSQVVVFKLPAKPAAPRNLLFKNGGKISEKFFH